MTALPFTFSLYLLKRIIKLPSGGTLIFIIHLTVVVPFKESMVTIWNPVYSCWQKFSHLPREPLIAGSCLLKIWSTHYWMTGTKGGETIYTIQGCFHCLKTLIWNQNTEAMPRTCLLLYVVRIKITKVIFELYLYTVKPGLDSTWTFFSCPMKNPTHGHTDFISQTMTRSVQSGLYVNYLERW